MLCGKIGETGMMKTIECFKLKYQNGKAALAAAS
jgi:hypothetical protein